MLQAGFATVDITPPLGVYLAGHFNARQANGLHDPLTAQALIFAWDNQQVAFLGCDLIGIPGELTSLVRQHLQTDAVMLWATHTHAGPILHSGWSEPRDEEYFRVLAAKLAGAVTEARRRMRPVQLKVGWGFEDRLSFNRRYVMKDGSVRTNPGVGNPEISHVDGPKDPAVGALFIYEAQGAETDSVAASPLAILVHFACHLDVLGNGNFLFSADYPFYMRQMLQAAYGKPLVIPFANGPCGNINHINVFAQRRQGGYDHARLMGMMLAGEILKIERTAEPLNVDKLFVSTRQIELQRRPYSDEELAEFRRILADERLPERAYPKIRARTHLERYAQGRASESVEIQTIVLGELALCGIPAEYFVEYGLLLRQRSPFLHTFVVELANDYLGYVPTPQAFDSGAYEGTSARFARETGDVLAESILEMLHAARQT